MLVKNGDARGWGPNKVGGGRYLYFFIVEHEQLGSVKSGVG